jgi:hypothetical protein
MSGLGSIGFGGRAGGLDGPAASDANQTFP